MKQDVDVAMALEEPMADFQCNDSAATAEVDFHLDSAATEDFSKEALVVLSLEEDSREVDFKEVDLVAADLATAEFLSDSV